MDSEFISVERSSNEQMYPDETKTISKSSNRKTTCNDNDTRDELNILLKPQFVSFLTISV
jgi:hypothetical protein